VHFRRLRLAGFKSFVEPVELRIEPGLTGVVGPNGCGKSNLLEAIRWVMGEGSAKSLRGGGMEDVIFAGTASRPSREFADVTLVLDNEDRGAPAGFNDSDTIEVQRRIERGLGSAYRLNGRDVRQRDVQLLFADAATGAHSPALVSQGRIGAIIAAKPVERRQLLEEAAGISGLHVRRREAEIRLRAADANLQRLDDVLRGLEAQAATLRRQARQAERYRQLSDRIQIVEAQLLFARWRAAADAAVAARQAAATLEAQVIEATRTTARLTTVQAEAAAALPQLREAEAAAAAAWQAQVQAGNAANAELLQVERRQRELAAATDQIRRDLGREAALAADAGAASQRLDDESATLQQRLADAQALLPELGAAVAAAEADATLRETELAAAIEAHARAAAQSRAALTAVESVRNRLLRTESEAGRVARELDAALEKSGDGADVKAAADAVEAAVAQLEAANAAVTASGAQRREAEGGREALQSAWLTARGALAGLTAERAALERQLASLKDSARAPIADSITVGAGYEAALAAALGDDLSAPDGKQDAGRFWELAASAADPALPAGAEPLANHVKAPAVLQRRLAQVGVVDDVEGLIGQLKPGQRLVTRAGWLWRWDGFRAFGGQGQAAAERFVARNRLAELLREIERGIADEAAAAAAREAGARALADSVAAEEAARSTRDQADRTLAAARTTLARTESEHQRREANVGALRSAVARLSADAESDRAELTAASAAAELAVDLAGLADTATKARAAAETARAVLAASRARQAVVTRDVEGDRSRLTAVDAERKGWTERLAASAAQRVSLELRAAAIAEEALQLAARPGEIRALQADIATSLQALDAKRQAASAQLRDSEAALRKLDQELQAAVGAQASAREARATAIANADHAEARRAEIAQLSIEKFGAAPLHLPEKHGFDEAAVGQAADLGGALDALVAERERIGPVNLRAETELEELESTRTGSAAEREELETAIARLRGSIGSINREGRVRLLEAFKQVDSHFRDLFATLFAGGAAHLELIESDDPLEAGLEIMAQPPGKKLQSLTLLSGGEQALTAVALIFALFLTNPAPICVLDEVDAPLDDANVERFCDLLDRMATTTATRFLIVTHNAVTMSRMHRLYGVTMAEQGVSQLVSVDLARAELLLAAQ
jgi:chromosome segregation protein